MKTLFDKAEYRQACFGGETYVLTKEREIKTGREALAWREIWHVKIGALVLSRCEITGQMDYRKVLKVFQHSSAEVFDVWYDCGPEYDALRGNPRPLLVTAEHPFWVEGKGWTEVRHLQPDDELLTHDGTRTIVKRVEKASYPAEVYNLEIEDFHTYFVGYEGVWVHNQCRK